MNGKKTKKRKKLVYTIFCLIMIYIIAHVTYIWAKERSESRIGVYSWHIDQVNYDEFEEVAKDLKINSFYQYVSSDKINNNNVINELVNFLDTIDIDTYLLCGSFEYSYDDEIMKLKQIIDEVANYNSNNEIKLKGIVLDVEFYLDSRYMEDTKQECFEIYYRNMKKAYEYSKEKGVKFILVIPYWLDTEFGEEALEILIRDACDSLEVMNYYKSKSIDHIASEIELAKKYNKSIVTISELQKVDPINSITEEITFYNNGLIDSKEDMEKILKEYKYNKLGYAYHYYEYLIELYNKENEKIKNF